MAAFLWSGFCLYFAFIVRHAMFTWCRFNFGPNRSFRSNSTWLNPEVKSCFQETKKIPDYFNLNTLAHVCPERMSRKHTDLLNRVCINDLTGCVNTCDLSWCVFWDKPAQRGVRSLVICSTSNLKNSGCFGTKKPPLQCSRHLLKGWFLTGIL